MLCVQYELNPLLRHVFLIPFEKKDKQTGKVIDTSWALVLGIQANRLIARRAGDFSYVDDTPRAATEDEIKRKYGDEAESIKKANLISITKLRDSKGNEASGWGLWPKEKTAYGADKGNTKRNMADIRSERQAMDRLFAGKLPQDVEVMDAEYFEVNGVGKVDGQTGEILDEPTAEELEAAAESLNEQEVPEPEETEEEESTQIPIDEPTEEKEEPERDHSTVTAEQAKEILPAVKKMGWNASDLGRFMQKDMGWNVSDLKLLEVWQYKYIMDMVKKEVG
jgi:hypothetical protein